MIAGIPIHKNQIISLYDSNKKSSIFYFQYFKLNGNQDEGDHAGYDLLDTTWNQQF